VYSGRDVTCRVVLCCVASSPTSTPTFEAFSVAVVHPLPLTSFIVC
jgi:hypothetical protein